jgi:hypothetical protein
MTHIAFLHVGGDATQPMILSRARGNAAENLVQELLMAINAHILEILLNFARQKDDKKRLICLGYPDMLVTEAQLTRLCGKGILDRIKFRDDSEQILAWHGLAGKMTRIAESQSVFAAVGIETDFLDIHPSRGCEITADFNGALSPTLTGRYDFVYDGGTMEHCFNVGQVMRNILALAKIGGYIVHVNPLNLYNHGFFGFSPTFYHDFYTQNGHRLASPCYGLFGPVLESQVVTLPTVEGFNSAPERMVVLVVAKKINEAEPGWPLQSKYRTNPNLRG